MPTNLLHHGSQNRIQKTSRNMAARKGPRLYKKESGTQREKKHVLTLTLMLVRRKSACKTSAGIFFLSCASVALARSSHNVVLINELSRCMFKCPFLGSRKWSIDLYAVLSHVRPTRKPNKTRTETTKNQKPTKQEKQVLTSTAPMGL